MPVYGVLTGKFTGPVIRLISDIRAKGGTVDLRNCGKFILAEDLSDIEDMTHINLRDISSLEGEQVCMERVKS